MNNSLKNKLKADYENLSEVPSGNLWGRLNAQLENEPQANKHFVLPNIWKYAAAVLLLIGIGGIVIQNFSPSQKKMKNSSFMASSAHKNHRKAMVKQRFSNSKDVVFYTKENTTKHFERNSNVVSPIKSVERDIIAVTMQYPVENKTNIEETTSAIKSNVPAEKIKYVTASDLLFEREVHKTLQNENLKLVNADVFQKPKEIKILGFTVYTDSQQ